MHPWLKMLQNKTKNYCTYFIVIGEIKEECLFLLQFKSSFSFYFCDYSSLFSHLLSTHLYHGLIQKRKLNQSNLIFFKLAIINVFLKSLINHGCDLNHYYCLLWLSFDLFLICNQFEAGSVCTESGFKLPKPST